MQYDKYESRIQKIADFIKLLFKHKIKVLIALASVMAMICTLLATRGIILSTGVCPAQITYGETLKYSGDAFMSQTDLEYAPLNGGKWTRSAPKDPGEYRVRVVADATFGTRHGKTETFTLLPRPVTLTVLEKQLTYGETPTVVAALCGKDSVAFVDFVYNEDRTQVSVNLETFRVQDEKGQDVTHRYVFTSTPQGITSATRPIGVTVGGATKVYDAKPLTCDTYQITAGSLAKGDQMRVRFLAELVNAGTVPNAVEIEIYNERGADVTEFYDITKTEENLTVEKRPVTIKTEGDTFVYDGKDHTYKTLSVISTEYGLIAGHKFSEINATVFNGVANERDNVVQFTVTENGKNVTDNYLFTYEYGKVTVTPRPITVKTYGFTREYDGENHENANVTSKNYGDLVLGHSVTAETVPVFNDVVTDVENKVVCKIVRNADNADVTKNYKITYEYGKVTVTKLAVTFVTATATKEAYDGEPFTAREWEVASTSKRPAKGHTLTGVEITGTQTDAGSSKNTFTGIAKIVDAQGEDKTQNYTVTLTEGTLTVNPRPLILATASASKMYDGEPLTAPVWSVHETSYYGLVQEDTIVGTNITGARTDVGANDNTYSGTPVFQNKAGKDVSKNYRVSNVFMGKLQVTQREIYVTTASGTHVYDDKAFSLPTWELTLASPNPLAPNQTLGKIVNPVSITNVGSVSNSASALPVIYDKNGNPVKEGNYKIVASYGTLEVTPRAIFVHTKGLIKTYDGEPWSDGDIYYDEVNEAQGKYALCNGHTFAVDPYTVKTFKNATADTNTLTFDIVKEGVGSVWDNYEVQTTFGSVKIERYEIAIKTPSIEQEYDGEVHTFTDITVIPGLLQGEGWVHEYEITYATEFLLPTENEPNEVEIVIWEKRAGEEDDDVTLNYKIDYETYRGKVTIKPWAVTVVTGSDSWVYDGQNHTVEEGFTVEGLVAGYSVKADFRVFNGVTVTEADTVNSATITIYKGTPETGVDVTENFEIKENFGTVTVEKRPIAIATRGLEKEFDGEEWQDATVEIDWQNSAYDLCVGHSFQMGQAPVFRNVTVAAENKFTFTIVDENGKPVYENYQIIKESYGSVTITPRYITITTPSDTWEYDGSAHKNTGWVILSGEFVYGHALTAPLITGTITEVARDAEGNVIGIPNTYEKVPYKVTGGVDETQNYVITVSEDLGTLTLTPIAVQVTTASDSKDYDGTPLTAPYWEIVSGGFILDHALVSPAIIGKQDGVGISKNYYDTTLPIVVADGQGVVKTHNYDVTLPTVEELGTLEIRKIKLSVTTASAQKVYDGAPLTAKEWQVTQGALLEGHWLDTANITGSRTNVNDPGVNTYAGEPRVLTVIDGEEVDVSSHYEITAGTGTLTVVPREIYLNTYGKDWIYDGTTFKNSDIEIVQKNTQAPAPEGAPCYEHEFRAVEETVKSFTNVWESGENIFDYTVTYRGEDVDLSNYIIYEEFGWVNIAARRATLSSRDIIKMYDGETENRGEITVKYDPAQGEIPWGAPCRDYVYKVLNEKEYRDVIEEVNEILFIVTYNGGEISKDNFVFTYDWGTVKITHRTVILYTEGDTWVYNGVDRTLENYTDGGDGIATGDTLEVDFPVFNGVVENAQNKPEVLVKRGMDNVTGNYVFDYSNVGTVTVSPRIITVKTNGVEKTYDGESWWDNTVEINLESSPYGLCEGHYFQALNWQEFVNVADSGVNQVEYEICDASGTPVSQNYVVSHERWGNVNISVRFVSVITGGANKVYDGEPVTEISATNVADRHRVSVDISKAQVDATVNLYGTAVWIDNPITWQDVLFTDEYGTVLDVKENYACLSFEKGRILISPRSLSITTESGEKTYDGIPMLGVTVQGLCIGHSLSMARENAQVNVTRNAYGVVDWIVNPLQWSDATITDTAGRNVMHNYTLGSFTAGDIKINPREVTVKTGSDSKEYDGTPLTAGWQITAGDLLPGHAVTMPEITGTQTLPGSSGNTYNTAQQPKVQNGDKDETLNYAITVEEGVGLLTVTPRRLTVSTGSQTWGYDGNEHSLTENTVAFGLLSGHRILLKEGAPIATVRYPGVQANQLTYVVVDAGGEDISEYYEISYVYGDLKVEKRLIYVVTEGADKDYDGTPLTCEDWYYSSEGWPESWEFIPEMEFTESIVFPGEVENKVVIHQWHVYEGYDPITGNYLIDHTEYCEIANVSYGYLIVYPPSDGPITYATVNTNVSTTLYLKMQSYGAYTGQGWLAAQEYPYYLNNQYSASYLTALALANGGGRANRITVKDALVSLLPYYAEIPAQNWQTSDTTVQTAQNYTANFYLGGATGGTGYTAFEEAYYEFVLQNYLARDTQTDLYMQSIIQSQGFNKDDPDIIQQVAAYIQNSAVYNLNYNSMLDYERNTVIAFLQTYKEGVCRHYAAAATMLFRALGIPARYTEGFAVQTLSGADIPVTQNDAHAWVEVYVKGVGWQYVEVTGSAIDPEKQTIIVKPATQSKKVDGTPLTPQALPGEGLEVVEGSLLDYLLQEGYTYTVSLHGSQTNVGTGVSSASNFVLYDPHGLPVTDQYNVQYEVGELKVYADIVAIYFAPSRNNIYNGTWYTVADTFYYRYCPQGITLIILQNNIRLRDVGALTANEVNENLSEYLTYVIHNEYGEDVTENYIVRVCAYSATALDGEGYEKDYEIITVAQHKLVLVTKSGTWTFDGQEHSASGVEYLKNTALPAGHVLQIKIPTVIQFPGTLENTYEEGSLCIMRVEYGNYVEVTDNFVIEISTGTLTVI